MSKNVSKKQTNSQIMSWNTYQLYLRKMLVLAENVFIFKNLPKGIDLAYMNKTLVRKGAIAFFYDEILDEVLALPFKEIGDKDLYDRPLKIQVIGQNGYQRILNKNEFVIMYDNNGRYPLLIDIFQFAERMSITTRITDVNIFQQKTPRLWQCPEDKEITLRNMLNDIDSMQADILTYKDSLTDITSAIENPAPYIVDKLDLHKTNLWNEYLSHIGIANLSIQKKERSISDEIVASMGGTVAIRFSRSEPRIKAIKEINEKFKDHLKDGEIEVKFYDGEPASIEEKISDNNFTFSEQEKEEDNVYDI